MGFMDKVKGAAEVGLEKAKEGKTLAGEKADELKDKKKFSGLLEEFGAAVFDERSEGATPERTAEIERLYGELKSLDEEMEREKAERAARKAAGETE